MKSKIGELVVKPRSSPWIKLVIAGVLIIGALAGFGAVYNHGLSMAGFDRSAMTQQQQRFQSELGKLKDENQDLRDALARTQLEVQIHQTSYQELDKSLKASAQEIVKLREELDFYRNIISPPNKAAGLQIQRLVITAAEPNQFRYKLVLIQSLKHDHIIGGEVRFEVRGEHNGKESTLHFPDASDKPIYVNFRYFQDVDGQFILPDNFKPQRVKVTVARSGGAGAEQTYNWPAK